MDLRAAIKHAGTALVSVATGLPAGDLVNYTRALFGQHGPASLKALARSVERDLGRWVDVEFGGQQVVSHVFATLDDLLSHHAMGLREVVEQHGMNEASVAAAILTEGQHFTDELIPSDRLLLQQLIEQIYRRYFDQRELLHELAGAALRALFAQQALTRQEFERVWLALESLTIPKPPPFSIPPPVADFTGYEAEIERVRAALANGSAAISAVQGIGGVGKTELARKVAALMRDDFGDGHILVEMLGTTQPRNARDAMTDVLVALGEKDIRPDSLAGQYQSRLAGKRLLILLDNVASRAGLGELVPPAPAALLVTSRTRLALPGVAPVELEKLSRDAAKALLARMVPCVDDALLDGLARLCADLPLALRVAGSYLQETGYPTVTYIAELNERRLARLARSAATIEDARLNPEIVLGHSYDRLAEADADLARAFTLLGVFPDDFDLAGAAAVLEVDENAAREWLTQLRRRSLVLQPQEGKRWRLHDLLRESAAARADQADREAAAARHQNYYLELLDWCATEHNNRRIEVRRALATFETERPNFTSAIDRATAGDDLRLATRAHLGMGVLDDALDRREDALAATEEAVKLNRRLAADQPHAFNHYLAVSLNNLGNRLNVLGRREDALAATEEAVALYRRRLAADQPDAFNHYLADSLNNLGIMLDALGRCQDALAATEEAVKLNRRLAADQPDAFNPDLASSLNNLGNRLNALGRPQDAAAAAEEAVTLCRRLAADRPDAFNLYLAMTLNNLGIRLDTLGRCQDALAATEEAVMLCRYLAADRPDTFNPNLALSLAARASCLEGLERMDEALASNVEAIEALRPTFLRLPQAVVHRMRPMREEYVERCQKHGVEPDAALLGPIDAVLRQLDAPGDEG